MGATKCEARGGRIMSIGKINERKGRAKVGNALKTASEVVTIVTDPGLRADHK